MEDTTIVTSVSNANPPRGTVFAVNGVAPRIAADVFIAPGAVIVGDVEIGPGASVWFNAVIRGDVAPIRIGARSNVQDGAVLHVDTDTPCIVGDDVTIGHLALVHGATVGNGVTIGMSSTVLSRSTIGEGAVIAAGAVIVEGADVPPGAVMMGVPARQRDAIDDARRTRLAAGAEHYVANARRYLATLVDVMRAEKKTPGGDADGR